MDAASIEVFCYLVQVVADVMVLGCQFLRFWNIHPEVIGYGTILEIRNFYSITPVS